MSNAPQTGQFFNLDAIARQPDASILIVDEFSRAKIEPIFPHLIVVGFTDSPKAHDAFKGRIVYVWSDYRDDVLPGVAQVASKCGYVDTYVLPETFVRLPDAAGPFVAQHLKQYFGTPQEKTGELADRISASVDLDLARSDKGIPQATLDNCVKTLERSPEFAGKIWFDTFLSRILHRWNVDIDTEWTDHNDIALALHLQRVTGIPRVTSRMAGEAVIAYAMREKRNCAYDWLDSLEWDQQPRLRELATKGFGTAGSEYEVAVCRNLILTMVRRTFEPGCKSDYMPIFEGAQGVGKSKALGILGGAWFAESHESVTSKDFYGVLQGKWLIEIAEMHAFKQADVDKIKGIVSCAVDRYRVPYGRHTADHARQCAFAGTTNRDDWNRDDTGARRFWPIKCGRIDHDWLIANRNQLFAEAVAFVRYNDEPHWIVPWDIAQSEQSDRRHEDTWELMFKQYIVESPSYEDAVSGKRLDQPEWRPRDAPLTEATVFNFLTEAMNMLPGRIGRGDEMRAGRAMKIVGWMRTRKRVGTKLVWVYRNSENTKNE